MSGSCAEVAIPILFQFYVVFFSFLDLSHTLSVLFISFSQTIFSHHHHSVACDWALSHSAVLLILFFCFFVLSIHDDIATYFPHIKLDHSPQY